ncbi:undecaprenyl-phosphate glucose phosphotransferase [Pantoea sp. 1.19]|uniref:undecaprenyl-phosphate glucose phosphotransferase n=1 Tax=Pantoea sp. 1.19 TaxID=1925589 RepID=UPI000948C36B|nr:undecaprenyl-phosphate glucose phosphotransferase [Pantoea sp. 1.19]
MHAVNGQRPRSNASIISMMQRFSDIFVMFVGLWLLSWINGQPLTLPWWLLFLTGLVLFQMIGGMTDFYRSWRGVSFATELQVIVQNWSLSMLIAAGLMAFVQLLSIPFNSYVIWWGTVAIGFIISRALIRWLARLIRKLGYNTRNVAIVGTLPIGVSLASSFIDAPWIGLNVVGFYADDRPEHRDDADPKLAYCGNVSQLVSDAREGRLDKIYIAMAMAEEQTIRSLVAQLTDTTCSVMLIPDIFTFNILQSRTEEVNGVPVVPLFETPMNGVNRVLKRLEDIIVSSLILLLISPALLTIAVLVKVSSPGPVIFRQVRYGMDGKPIRVWKFRSMKVMENGAKVVQATKGDARITPIGRILRSTSLDELPQFFNVLKGDMSIVGPRPHAVAHNEQYRALIQGYMLRHKVKPGITGWAQINGWRGETDTLEKMEKRVEYDLQYIRDWSIAFDLRIIFLTIFKGFISKTAY